jgi:hypothetical protein
MLTPRVTSNCANLAQPTYKLFKTHKNRTICGLLGLQFRCRPREATIMLTRACPLIALTVFVSALAIAGPKKKDELPAYLLKAQTVAVVVDPSYEQLFA